MTKTASKARLSSGDRDFLKRLQNGWQPLCLQASDIGTRLEKRSLVRRDWGTDEGKTDKFCWFITPAGSTAIVQ